MNEYAKLIGVWGPWLEAPHPIDNSDRRRFTQGAMDEDPLYFSDDVAAVTRYGAGVLPALYPLHASRRAEGSPDPFDRLIAEPDWDGADLGWESAGLPKLELPRLRAVNAGSRVELFQLPRVGDRIKSRSMYVAIEDKEGRNGPMTRVVVRTEYANQHDERLLIVENTIILR